MVFWGQPTGKIVALLAVLLLVALAPIEFLSQPPQHTVVAPQPDLNPAPGLNTQARQPLTCCVVSFARPHRAEWCRME